MRTPVSLLFAALIGIALVLPAQAQNNLAQNWRMTPILGHGQQLEAALAAHAKWRMEHNDPWSWNATEILTGAYVGSFSARSGGHTWGDFDEYAMWEHAEAAQRHFNDTVAPHLAELRSSISTGDADLLRWPEDEMAVNVLNVVGLELHSGEMPNIVSALKEYHKAIEDHDFDAYHYVGYNASGGSYDVVLAFPGSSMGDFAPKEKTVQQLMIEVHGEEGFKKLQQKFSGAIKNSEDYMIARRRHLDVKGAETMAGN